MALRGTIPTKLVGILNITPDSFSDGGLFAQPAKALAHAKQLFADGASIVDVGAESTRPHATPLTASQEWQRLKLVLPALMQLYPGKISLDTRHPQTAERALQLGEVIINDVTGMNNPNMVDIIARHHASCIISHLPGTDIQLAHRQKPASDINTVLQDLLARRELLISKDVPAANIILDPGISFGKTPELNWQLLKFAAYVPGLSVMVGYSRKRFLGEGRMQLAPNLKAGRAAVNAGAIFLRVHDVAGHKRLLDQQQ